MFFTVHLVSVDVIVLKRASLILDLDLDLRSSVELWFSSSDIEVYGLVWFWLGVFGKQFQLGLGGSGLKILWGSSDPSGGFSEFLADLTKVELL